MFLLPVHLTIFSLTVAHARKLLAYRFLFATGANVTIPVRFLNTDMAMGSITAGIRALSFNLLFLGKFAVKAFFHPDQCAVCVFSHVVVDGLLSLYIFFSNLYL